MKPELLGKAIAIVAEAFKNDVDKGGQPYVLHCLHVMNDTQNPALLAKTAAVLHDLFEDKPNEWNEDRLLKEGFPFEVCRLVRLLSHDKSMTYDQYIERIATDPICVQIKMADLRHNSNITRLKDVGKKDFDRMQRYSIAYKYLARI